MRRFLFLFLSLLLVACIPGKAKKSTPSRTLPISEASGILQPSTPTAAPRYTPSAAFVPVDLNETAILGGKAAVAPMVPTPKPTSIAQEKHPIAPLSVTGSSATNSPTLHARPPACEGPCPTPVPPVTATAVGSSAGEFFQPDKTVTVSVIGQPSASPAAAEQEVVIRPDKGQEMTVPSADLDAQNTSQPPLSDQEEESLVSKALNGFSFLSETVEPDAVAPTSQPELTNASASTPTTLNAAPISALSAARASFGIQHAEPSKSKLKLQLNYPALARILCILLLLTVLFLLLSKIFQTTKEKLAPKREFINTYPPLKRAVNLLGWLLVCVLIYASFALVYAEYSEGIIGRILQAVLVFLLYLIINKTIDFIAVYYFKDSVFRKYFRFLKIITTVLLAAYFIAQFWESAAKNMNLYVPVAVGIIMYAFQDMVLDFVAVLWLRMNDLIEVGDWIEVKDRQIDGTVEKITMTLIKVRQWDNTLTLVPAYGLISKPFINWRQIIEKHHRRIKRSIHIDVQSLKKIDAAFLRNLPAYLNKEYFGQDCHAVTNLQAFVYYAKDVIKRMPKFYKDELLLVRELAPTETGLPLEFYFFVHTDSWEDYENTQSDFFDFIIPLLEAFDLRLFQSVSGHDLCPVRKPFR